MRGSGISLLQFMEGANNRYVIPVYQRKYEWKQDNCQQLYMDLKRVVAQKRNSHFFGSIVSSVMPDGAKIEYHIIDGQQRLTTITLLLLAIRNLVIAGKVKSQFGKLDEEINMRFLTAPWSHDGDTIKLHLVKSDRDALEKLFGPTEDFDPTSPLTQNYQFFCNEILKEELSVDALYAAIGKLEIISITLEQGDDAQLIFESLNSTGLALPEGDKIRNYVLMGLSPRDQKQLYEDYWCKIETCTNDDVSVFVRDYLSIKQQTTPTISAVYRTFKEYAETSMLPTESLLRDMLCYARLFQKLWTCRSELDAPQLDACLYRMKRLEINVTRPFLMQILKLNLDGKISATDVQQIFLMVENYLFRRNICEVPTNALNKVFLNLNKEILRFDNTTDRYVDKLAYSLRAKKESSRFPDDREFVTELANKQVYQMRGKYKAYLFERFENFGTVETKDVFRHLDQNTYTIEHIMPQHLTPEWIEDLGPNYADIHATWLHRLANLTLTGYNPSLSNNTFSEKRDAANTGYKESGLRMNQKIATKTKWGLAELEERNQEMMDRAIHIWAYPQTDFQPAVREFDSCTLDDEDVDLTGRDLAKFSYRNSEQPASSWVDMFERIVKSLHQRDTSVLMRLAYCTDDTDLAGYVSPKADRLRSALLISDNIYVERNTSTALKLSILRRLFALYGEDPTDLVFYLKEPENEKHAETTRLEICRRYWEYAIPLIQRQNCHRGTFSGVSPRATNSIAGFFGISGFYVSCVANQSVARIDFCLGKSDPAKNKEAFDNLFSHKAEIEEELGMELVWERANQYKISWVCLHLKDVNVMKEADWPRMAKFHAEWSDKICNAMLPYLSMDDEGKIKLDAIASILREWTTSCDLVQEHPEKSGRKLTRFTTKAMSKIIPDTPDAVSGWNTPNRYFYEIVNSTGNSIYIKLAVSAKNATSSFIELSDKINELNPAKLERKEWQWRTLFRTKTMRFSENPTKEEIFACLDKCLQEILIYEEDVQRHLESNHS